jgi:cell division transport system permease protein
MFSFARLRAMEKSHLRSRKKKLGSYPSASVVFSITLALFVIGLFGLMLLHTNQLKNAIRNNVSIQIYLDKYVTENERIKINRLLANKAYVASDDDAKAIEFISKETAAKEFIQDSGEDFTEFMGENPLRDAFSIKIMESYQHVDSLNAIKQEISLMDGVFEVVYVESLIAAINKNFSTVSLLLLSFAGLLLLAVVVLINNTMKLALFSQRFLIRSMQLVGARHSFIISPFLKRAAVHGLLAGVLASAILVGLLSFANLKVAELKVLQDHKEMAVLFTSLLLIGLVIGIASTFRSVNKYLRLSLDELY